MKYQIGDPVITPVGIGTVEGCVRLHGRVLVLVNLLPEELRVAEEQIHGVIQISMVPEELVKRFEAE